MTLEIIYKVFTIPVTLGAPTQLYIHSRDSVTRFFASGFFESVSPQPQSIPLGPFQIFSKIRGDIRKSPVANLPPVSTTPAAKLLIPVANLPPMSTTLVVVHLALRISPRIFEKFRNGPDGILRGLGETDS
jgi:hypothetical protein